MLGILSCCVGGLLLGIPAIIMGAIALKQVNEQPGRYSSGSRGMAITGIVLGAIMTLVSIIVLLIYGLAIFAIIEACIDDAESDACQDYEGASTPGGLLLVSWTGEPAAGGPAWWDAFAPWRAVAPG